ncbi:MAG: nitrous oxide reductase accessory protein NosL [Desulfurivibrio sp.]|nr:nitrous oxide reductase accessory protein NosL [Desulfurivibrio sp.]
MMSKKGWLLLILLLLWWPAVAVAQGTPAPVPEEKIDAREKCPVCGMFPARYPQWISQLQLAGGEVFYFDGMKDLLAYYFNPAEFGGAADQEVAAIWTRDYYTTEWIDARRAYFVTGSDVHGPMGHEFVPLASEDKARSFKKDHGGEQILRFEQIDPELVHSLRSGHRMRGGH